MPPKDHPTRRRRHRGRAGDHRRKPIDQDELRILDHFIAVHDQIRREETDE